MKAQDLIKRTKRLVIRPYTLDDYGVWKEAFSNISSPSNKWDWDAERFSANKLTKESYRQLLRHQAEDRNKDFIYFFGIFHKKTGELIGILSLMDISRQIFQNAYLGYHIFSWHWRKGYGREAIQATVEIAFKQLGLHRVEAGISRYNIRSIRLVKSLGFRREGSSKRRLFLKDKWEDMQIYALTCEDVGIRWNQKFRGKGQNE